MAVARSFWAHPLIFRVILIAFGRYAPAFGLLPLASGPTSGALALLLRSGVSPVFGLLASNRAPCDPVPPSVGHQAY